MASLGDIRKGEASSSPGYQVQCPKHNEITHFYCETCQELLCRECAATHHGEQHHRVIDVAATSHKYQSLTRDSIPAPETDIQDLAESLAATSRARREFEAAVTAIREEVEDTAAMVIEDVHAAASRAFCQIRAVQQIRLEEFDRRIKAKTEVLKQNQSSHLAEKDGPNTAKETGTNHAHLTVVNNKEEGAIDQFKVDQRLAYLRFRRGKVLPKFFLGTLRLEAKWELCCEFGKQGKGPGEFDGAHAITSPRPDEIAVADWHNKRIVICKLDGRNISTLQTPGNPRCVASVADHLVVVDTTPEVKMYNPDGTVAHTLLSVPQSEAGKTDVDLRAVIATGEGTFLVSDAKRNLLTEHRVDDSSVIRTLPVSVRPSYLATDAGGTLVVSGGVQTVHVVRGYSAKETTTCTTIIRPSIEGWSVRHSNGVCCDHNDIYIAVDSGEGTGHIHRYRSNGEFLDCAVQGLRNPYGIAFIADGKCLAVADCYSVKLFHRL